MASQIQHYWRRILHWYWSLSQSEKVIVSITGACLVVFGIYQAGLAIEDYISVNNRALAARKTQLENIEKTLKRYLVLKNRQENLQKTFAKSEMTFEQVTAQLDHIVRDSMGNDNYDLKKSRTPTAFGFEYEKQEFTVNIRTLSMDQLVKLLYQLEQGERPLFLSKLDIIRSSTGNEYGATLEIYSIAKAKTPATATSQALSS